MGGLIKGCTNTQLCSTLVKIHFSPKMKNERGGEVVVINDKKANEKCLSHLTLVYMHYPVYFFRKAGISGELNFVIM